MLPRYRAFDDASMGFWRIKQPEGALAAVDARSGRKWSYAALRDDSARIQAALPCPGRKSLGLVLAQNRYECLTVYLAALNADTAIILLDAGLNSVLLRDFVEAYRPDWVYTGQLESDFADGYRRIGTGESCLFEREQPQDIKIHPDLALLLNTSGSTGSQKLVRLSLRNLAANADSIAEYLQLTPEERPITSLPLSYSYGLSVVNSHLQAGAAIVFTEDGVLRREFWDAVDRYACTSFAGVPYTYQLLLQAGLLNKKGASLKMLTQAGGKLDDRYILQMEKLALTRGWKFFVMYGQTEAAPRISYVPFEQLGRKRGSVGVAIPGGSLDTDEHTGELIYSGPNVMLGYAECREDLAKGDELNGILRTGDLARQDSDGYFYITGRMKRFLKLFGKRFSLDEVENALSRHFNLTVACYGRDDLLTVVVEGSRSAEDVGEVVRRVFDLPRTAIRVAAVATIPRTGNGKVDYARLADAALENALTATQ